MKVLHFGSNYLPNRGGNVVRMTNMLENNSTGAQLFVLTTAEKYGFDDEAYYQKNSVRIFRISELSDAYKVLPMIVEKYKIDVVITHTIPANIIACRCLPNQVKIMTEIHSLIDSGKLKNFAKDMLHRFYLNRRTEKYFVLSMGAANYIKGHYGVPEEKIVFLPNGRDENGFCRTTGRKGFFTFGYIGTFYQWQGIKIIYDNLEKILQIGDDVRVYLVGGGEMENELRVLAGKYPDRVIMTGLIPKEEVKLHYQEIDILMIPRPFTLETETAIPLKIFDSVEAGKPVIISDVFGLIEVLGADEAFVYHSKDPDGLIHACKEAYEDPDICMKKFEKAAQRMNRWPSWEELHDIQYQAINGVLK